MNNEVENFLEALLSAGLIDREDFGSLSSYPTPEDVFEAVEITVKSNIKLTEVYAKFRDLPFVQINSIDQKAIGLIDRDLARRFGFIPFFIDEQHKILQIAITDPRKLLVLNREKLNELGRRLNYRIEVMMASREQVEIALLAKSEPIEEQPIVFEPPKHNESDEAPEIENNYPEAPIDNGEFIVDQNLGSL
jgi:hypothetical protein